MIYSSVAQLPQLVFTSGLKAHFPDGDNVPLVLLFLSILRFWTVTVQQRAFSPPSVITSAWTSGVGVNSGSCSSTFCPREGSSSPSDVTAVNVKVTVTFPPAEFRPNLASVPFTSSSQPPDSLMALFHATVVVGRDLRVCLFFSSLTSSLRNSTKSSVPSGVQREATATNAAAGGWPRADPVAQAEKPKGAQPESLLGLGPRQQGAWAWAWGQGGRGVARAPARGVGSARARSAGEVTRLIQPVWMRVTQAKASPTFSIISLSFPTKHLRRVGIQ